MSNVFFYIRFAFFSALACVSFAHAQNSGVFEIYKTGELSTLPAYIRSEITAIPAGAEVVLQRNPYGSFTSGVLKYKNLSVTFKIGSADPQNYLNALHVVDDYMKIVPEVSRFLAIPVPARPLEIKNTFWSFGDGTGYGVRAGASSDVLQLTHTHNGGASYSGGLSHEIVHFMEEYCPAAASRTNKFALCEIITTAVEARYNPASAFFDQSVFFKLYDNSGAFNPSAFESVTNVLLDPTAYSGGINQDVYWSSRLLMDELVARSGLSGDAALLHAKNLIDKARSVAGSENVVSELGFASFEALNEALEKRFLATHPAKMDFPVAATKKTVVVYDHPLPNPSQKELVDSINKAAKANVEIMPYTTPTNRSTAGAGIRTFARRTAAAVGIAGVIMAAHDMSTTSADERVVAGFLEQMRRCSDSLPDASDTGFWDALKDQFPAWAMNLGSDDIGRMVMGKDFDEKFAKEFAGGMAYIQKNCPSVWSGIKVSPKLAPFRQATLDWIGRIPEIHGELKTEMSSRPASWSDYLPWNRSPAEKKNPRPPLFRGRDIIPPFEGVMMP